MTMECYCEPMEADGYADCWSITTPKARKAHICCECKDTIKPGEKYERIFSIYDGAINVYKTCLFCAAEFKRLDVKRDYYDPGLVKGDLACALVWDMREEARQMERAK